MMGFMLAILTGVHMPDRPRGTDFISDWLANVSQCEFLLARLHPA